jgi:NhaA family Na+:H+ antiporter
MPPFRHRSTWIHSDRRLARIVARPVHRFLEIEASGGLVLIVAAVAALVWANSPWKESYTDLLHTVVELEVGSFVLREDVQHWVNDGLMTLFFFVVGLEIKREWVSGELRDRRAAALPAIAAVGGMVVPAAIYAALNVGGPGGRGWGIPMATDIAFALGVVAVLGRRVPPALKVFLLTLAIVDDIGAILVIAVFYSSSVSLGWLAVAAAVVLAVVLLRRGRVWYHPIYVVLGVTLWLAVFESGVHATIAGVVMGLLTPARPFLPDVETERIVDTLEHRAELRSDDVRRVSFMIAESVPLTERIERALHPWTSFVVVPVFALANAGIELTGDSLSGGSGVALGVVLGLVVGKTIGISLFSWVACRLGVASLPSGAGWPHLVGVAALAGIGFTVSLFVAGLAFAPGSPTEDQAKIGILAASVLAAAIGTVVLSAASRRRPSRGRPALVPTGPSAAERS